MYILIGIVLLIFLLYLRHDIKNNRLKDFDSDDYICPYCEKDLIELDLTYLIRRNKYKKIYCDKCGYNDYRKIK